MEFTALQRFRNQVQENIERNIVEKARQLSSQTLLQQVEQIKKKERLCALCHQVIELDDQDKFKDHKIKASRRQQYYCPNSGKFDAQSLSLPQR